MKLLFDIGNSAIKWTEFTESGFGPIKRSRRCDENLNSLFENQMSHYEKPEVVLVSNVAGAELESQLTKCCEALWGLQPVYLRVGARVAGVENSYDDVTQLGIDRWLVIVAAWCRFQAPVCVIDCGTAITVDLIDASGKYIGGYISPGLALMNNALARHTSKLDEFSDYKAELSAGTNTRDCISSGIQYAIKGMITTILDTHLMESKKAAHCVITGGGADEISKLIDRDMETDPYLLFSGMLKLGDEYK